MPSAQRALILVRLSRMTDATTSPERQEDECRTYCQAQGMTVVGVAVDTDVSGSTDPLDRPALGPWLRDRMSEFDVVVASKLDRVGRNMRHIYNLMDYLQQASKSLMSVKENIDIAGAVGQFLVMALALAAQLELESIQERNRGAAQHNIRAGKYRGGVTPVGYRSIRDSNGDWRLTPDEEGTAPAVREIVRRVIAGDRLAAIVGDLNRRNIPTHKDRQAVLNGRESEGRGWTISNVKRLLMSPALLGYVVTGEGKDAVVMRDDSGEPISRTDVPVISEVDFYKVRGILAARAEAEPKQKKSADSQLLTRVIFCECGEPMYRLKGGPGRSSRYRCNSTVKGKACGSGSAVQATADHFVEETLLLVVGDRMMMERQYVAGSDNALRIADLNSQLETLAESVGRFPAGSKAQKSLMARVDSLSAQLSKLESEPTSESGYVNVPTGETFREAWEGMAAAERNDYLRTHSVKLTHAKPAGGTDRFTLDMDDLASILGSTDADMDAETEARDLIRRAKDRVS